VNPDIKQKWVDALRSGVYAQGRLALKRPTEEGAEYCCLGVLCELAKTSGELDVKERTSTAGDNVGFYVGEAPLGAGTAYPVDEIRQWAGLNTSEALLPQGFNYTSPRTGEEVYIESLAAANDHGMTFDQIAELIERHF
jgi:hypothetical protein